MCRNDDYQLDINDLGYKIMLRRHELGMSMDELAARIHSDKSAISRIENGDRVPRYDTFLKIADALQIHPALLCAERGENAEMQLLLFDIADKITRLPPGTKNTALSSIHAMLDGFLLQNNISNT